MGPGRKPTLRCSPPGGTPLQGVGRDGGAVVAVAVLVVGGDELLRVAVDAVLGDVEAVELLLRLDPEAAGGLEQREDRVGGQEDEPAGGDDAQGLHAELREAAAVE